MAVSNSSWMLQLSELNERKGLQVGTTVRISKLTKVASDER